MEPVHLIKDAKSLTKRASAKSLLKYAKTKGQEDLHIIALGALEGTGYNRNGDGFAEYWCQKNAHYFSDADRAVHRHHKNKSSDPKFGNIKAAAYNPEMKRLELIVGLDIDKCADILDEQEKKGVTNWSMASKQAHDVCSWCDHKASTDLDRCEHIPDKIGEINKQGQMCGMDNPDPHWFEVSHVKRGADRIGLSLQKAAGEKVSRLLPRDYLNVFPGFDMSPEMLIISKTAAAKRAILGKLAEMEKYVSGISEKKLNPLLTAGKTEKLAAEVMDILRDTEHKKFLKIAAENGIILSPDNFFSYVFGSRIKQAAIDDIKTLLPTIFTKVAQDADVLNNERFDIPLFLVNTTIEKKALNLYKLSHSLYSPYVKQRIVGNVKEAANRDQLAPSKDVNSLELAKQYVSYKLAALSHIADLGKMTDDLLLDVVIQNRV